MRIVFMGSADFSLPSLQALLTAKHEIVAVVTQPDRPQGRGGKPGFTPVKKWALANHIPLLQPEKVNAPEVVAQIAALRADVLVVVAFGQILKKELLTMTKYGAVNVHGSLLPAYRGAAPIHWAIRNGEKQTGVTVMQMDAGMDTGPILAQTAMDITESDTVGSVHDRMAALGAEALLKVLAAAEAGGLKAQPQNEAAASYASLLKKEHERIDWHKNVTDVHNQIRGMSPFPGAYTIYRGERLKIWQSEPAIGKTAAETPGTVLVTDQQKGILVCCGQGALWLKTVQPAGKNKMTAMEFVRGNKIAVADRLGE